MVVKQRYFIIANVAALYGALIVFIIIPYLRFNQILQWDSIGHLFSAWNIREHLWPLPTGWNPFFFAGYPQGIFYPPLFHWTVAALSFLIPLQLAFKILVSVAVLATPLSFLWFARAFGFRTPTAMVAMTGMTSLIIAPFVYSLTNNYVGGTLTSTFHIGLVVNALALPLFFAYGASLRRGLEAQHSILPSILFALLILTHVYTALVGVFFLVIVTATIVRSRAELFFLFRHVGLTAALAAFWLIPFIVFLPFSETSRADLVLGLGSFILVLLGLALIIILYMRGQAARGASLIIFFLLLTIGILTLNYLGYQVHIYRLVLIPILLVPLFILWGLPARWHWTVALIGFGLIIWGLNFKGSNDYVLDIKGPGRVPRPPLTEQLPARTFLLSSPQYQVDQHTNQHLLPMDEGAIVNKGLFVESSKSSKYLLTLERMLDPDSMAWGVPFADGSHLPREQKKFILDQQLRRFGFNAVVAPTTQTDFTFTKKGPAFAYSILNQHAIVPFRGSDRPILFRSDPLYFTVVGDELALVKNEFGTFQVTFFSLPTIPDRAALEADSARYYVNRLDNDVLLIDFKLEQQPSPLQVDALSRLRALVSQPGLTDEERRQFTTELNRLQDELEQTNANYAQAKYANDPTIALTKIGQTSIRLDQLKIQEEHRVAQFDRYDLPPTFLIEPLVNQPEIAKTNWERTVDAWFLSSDADHELVYAQQGLRLEHLGGEISKAVFSQNHDRISFHIDAEQPIPVLVKESYFPKWRATANEKPIPIFRAAPNLMLVVAHGDVELRYSTLWFEWVGWGMSTSAVLALLGLPLFRTIRQRRKNRGITTSAGP